MRLIILAAGHGYALDGMVKCLLRHPLTGRTFLDHAMDFFHGCSVTVVVGYRAVEIMQQYPKLDYVYNHEWAVTSNSYSLGLALSDEPCFVCSSDTLYPQDLRRLLDEGPENLAVTACNENRGLTAINCMLDGERIVETYLGPLKDARHPEAIGVFKISDGTLLRGWKRNCLKHGNLFVGQTLPLTREFAPVHALDKGSTGPIYSVETPLDYRNLISALRERPQL